MPKAEVRADVEIAKGRYWRAKQILSGRIANSHYDAEIFRRYAVVLQAMNDDDEAGRYYFLAGTSEGNGSMLAREFLARREGVGLRELWLSMPKAAHVLVAAQCYPEGVALMLREAGHSSADILEHFDLMETKKVHVPTKRRALNKPISYRTNVFGWIVFGLFIVTLLLGVVRLGEIIKAVVVSLF
jgi:hypothetical protein